jgi:hypothetical protein
MRKTMTHTTRVHEQQDFAPAQLYCRVCLMLCVLLQREVHSPILQVYSMQHEGKACAVPIPAHHGMQSVSKGDG